MKKYLPQLAFLFLLSFSSIIHSQVVYKEVKAKIHIDKVENMVAVTGTVENLKSEYKSVSYKLTVFRNNKANSNKSNNSQSGRLTLDPSQKKTLSTTQININKDDQIILLLLIYDEDNQIIGKDRIILGEEDNSKAETIVPVDGYSMIGIVSNDTKTKLGNDFYDFFFYEFGKLKIKTEKNISVQEELTFGRTSKISVTIGNDSIIEFITRPDEDFLKYMAIASSENTFKYLKNIEKQEKSIFQY